MTQGSAGDFGTPLEAIHHLAAADPVNAYARVGYADELTGEGSNFVGTCPFHAESDPSFCISRSGDHAGRWKCFGCGSRGDLIDFYRRLHGATFREAIVALGQLFGLTAPSTSARCAHKADANLRPQERTPPSTPDPLPASHAKECHKQLLQRPKALDWLTRRKGLPAWIVEDALIGYSVDHWREARFTIPIPYLDCSDNTFRDIRGYRPNPGPRQPKMLPWGAGRGTPTVYPWPWVCGNDELVWCEGEIDALNLIGRGMAAVTATCGVDGAVGQSLVMPNMAGKTVYVLGDHDAAGQRLTEKLPERLYDAGAVRVVRLQWPGNFPDGRPLPKGYDLSDWCADGATSEDVWRLIRG